MSAHPNKRFLVYMSSMSSAASIRSLRFETWRLLKNSGFTTYVASNDTDANMTILSRSDALFVAPSWEESNYAVAEISHAQKWGIPIFYDIEALKTWAVDTPKPDVI